MPSSTLPHLTGETHADSVILVDDAVDQALHWFVTLSSGEVTAQERAAFDHWLTLPQHQESWRQVQQFQSALQGMPAPAAVEALRSTQAEARSSRRVTRRRAIVLLAAVGAGLVTLSRRDDVMVLTADAKTATGEQRTMVLDDGSRLTLDTGTAVDIRFNGLERRLVLRKGAVYVETAHASAWASQPFVVETAMGEVRALGTRFSVRELQRPAWLTGSGGLAQVAVSQGRVRITPQGSSPIELPAGRQVRFDSSDVYEPELLDVQAQAWAQGRMVVNGRPLGELLADLARYRPGVIQCDDDVAGMRISGVFSLDDTDRVLDMLAQALPIEIRRHTSYWVTVRARASQQALAGDSSRPTKK